MNKDLPQHYIQKIKNYFPNAARGDYVTDATIGILQKHDITNNNTLFGTSCCPDEVNEFVTNFKTTWENRFPLAGLGGIPFSGMTGFNTFLSHAADNGNLFIVFASHIGIDEYDKLGVIRRKGMKKETLACGSAITAYNYLLNRESSLIDSEHTDEWDLQQKYIETIVERSFLEIRKSKEPILALTEVVYDAIYKKILKIIPNDCESNIVLLGGIQINTSLDFFDYFLIKEFKVINQKLKTEVSYKKDLTNVIFNK